MQKVTPEILKQMEASGKPIIRVTMEELSKASIADSEEIKKKLLYTSTKK
jgi:hypothetical protein